MHMGKQGENEIPLYTHTSVESLYRTTEMMLSIFLQLIFLGLSHTISKLRSQAQWHTYTNYLHA
jgi:hypothetical protein